MSTNNPNTVYFLGIGGIGMSAIARYYLAMGCKVFGYDKTKTILTEQLESEGALIHYKEEVEIITNLFPPLKERSGMGDDLIIYTPAIPKENKELIYFQENGFSLYKRAEVLGLISKNYFTIAVAGTHGKTTTSSIVAHILNDCGTDCIAFLGGISLNFNSNLLLNDQAKIMVLEADEFDRSFLQLLPDIALITSLDADHLDIYGEADQMLKSYQDFVRKIKPGGKLITKPDFFNRLKVNDKITYESYSLSDDANCKAVAIQIKNGSYFVDVDCQNQRTKEIELGLPGIHNVENAIGAFAIANELQIDNQKIKAALTSYKGVKRRFEYHIKNKDIVYIDDYAHHPTELEFSIKSAKELFPDKKITGIFQPHLYSRTRDFVDEFAASLSLLDELILLDIYPARELPIEGVTSQIIFDKVKNTEKVLLLKGELMEYLNDKNVEVLMTLGAGDIDVFVQPIKELLINKTEKIDE
jgi:UDP-N-acetylmuramate--alanine ligase